MTRRRDRYPGDSAPLRALAAPPSASRLPLRKQQAVEAKKQEAARRAAKRRGWVRVG